VPKIVKAETAADFLFLIPDVLGYTPTDSLLIVVFDENERTKGAVRFDLPHGKITDEDFRDHVVHAVSDVSFDSIILVAYPDQVEDLTELSGLINCLADKSEELKIRDAYIVYENEYIDWNSPDMEPRALATRPVTGDQHIEPVPFASSMFGEPGAPEVLYALTKAIEGNWQEPDETLHMCGGVAVMVKSWPAEELTPVSLADVILGTNIPAFRDVMLVYILAGREMGDKARVEQEEYNKTHDLSVITTGDVMLGMNYTERPDFDKLRNVIDVMRRAASVAPPFLRSGPLSVAAWLSWIMGNGTHASDYAQLALDFEPDHGLSGVIKEMAANGHTSPLAKSGTLA
jgi:hypothetical protein